ncbi:hypothetical protein JOB18_031558 [Solea senegalensis]|uniref:Uncharacterized protein n=1 Tax=Solea senegalensis TaxID=28829 RepID=A0AAV6R895_SOLSE|nr:hypothetical protein JOB18_031558 [Solea senegalensis]
MSLQLWSRRSLGETDENHSPVFIKCLRIPSRSRRGSEPTCQSTPVSQLFMELLQHDERIRTKSSEIMLHSPQLQTVRQ